MAIIVVLLLIVTILLGVAAVMLYQNGPEGNRLIGGSIGDLSFDPSLDQLALFVVGLVFSWVGILWAWYVAGWSYLWHWGTALWWAIFAVQMIPPTLNALLQHIRSPYEDRLWGWLTPVIFLVAWGLLGQWVAAVVLAVVLLVALIYLIILGLRGARKLGDMALAWFASGKESGD
ncbi:MAG: hypothetical protein WC400_03765 [Patescibacteria group bacterium]|jgi:hypothetical protein